MNLFDWSSEAPEDRPSVLAYDPARNRWDFVIEPLDEPIEGRSIEEMPVEVLIWVTFIEGEFTISTWDHSFEEIFTDVDLENSKITETENALTRWGVR
jgi:hypothetical protein